MARRCTRLALAGLVLTLAAVWSAPGFAQSASEHVVIQRIATGMRSPTQRLIASPSGALFAVNTSGELQRSDDAGQSWRHESLPPRADRFFAPDGTLLTKWRGLRGPAGVAVDASGNVYVADTNANRVVELAPDGSQVATWGTFGTGLGQFWEPEGVAVDPQSGSIYVADTFNNRVVRIDPAAPAASTR